MNEIAATFGFEWPKFIAQVIILLIVYGFLSKFAFGPILELLNSRRQRIIKSEDNFKKSKIEISQATEEKNKILRSANSDAHRIIEEAKENAEAIAVKKLQETTLEVQSIIQKAKEASEQERQSVMSQLKGDFGRLVIDATSKVTEKVLDSQDKEKINKEIINQVSI